MQVTRDENTSGIFQFLSIAILLALCSLLPTLINFGITSTPIQKIWENDFGFQLFLKGVIYIWLLLLAIFPLLSKPISVAKIFIIAILLYFLLRFPQIIESQSLKSTIPYSVMSILGPTSIYTAALVVAKLLHWQEESSNSPDELAPASPPFSMMLRKFTYAAIFPILLMSIIPAIIALQAFINEPLYAFYLMVPASSVLHYWQFGFVALLGIAIASFVNFRRWSIYFAVTCATIPIVTKYQSLKFPEGKLIVLSYLIISVLILMWVYFFNRWVRVETKSSFAE